MDAHGISKLGFSVFFYACSVIELISTDIETVSIAMISLGSIGIEGSVVNTSALSCRANTGIGRGTNIQYEGGYCTSGSSSCGYGSISNPAVCSDIVQYFMFLSHSLPYISKGPYLSTGSGGYGYPSQGNAQAGAGGGIIFMLANQTTFIFESKLLADGGAVWEGEMLSGGSGGTIFMTTNFLEAVGGNNVSAAGGNSTNNNGSGAGGLVKVSYQNAISRSLWININEGYQSNSPSDELYSNGIFFGPTCSPGYQAIYLSC